MMTRMTMATASPMVVNTSLIEELICSVVVINEDERHAFRQRCLNGWQFLRTGCRHVDGVCRRCRIDPEECAGRTVERNDSIRAFCRKLHLCHIAQAHHFVAQRLDRHGPESFRCLQGGLQRDRCRNIIGLLVLPGADRKFEALIADRTSGAVIWRAASWIGSSQTRIE